jgi:type 1 glutamine amidotransferase
MVKKSPVPSPDVATTGRTALGVMRWCWWQCLRSLVRVKWILLGALSVGVVAAGVPREVVAVPPAAVRVLVFSKTSGFRHGSIAVGGDAIEQLGTTNGFTVDRTEDAASFTASQLSGYAAVVFLSTSGDVLAADQQAAFEEYIRNGGGYVGIHSAADTEYDWAWYGGLVGAYFLSHPEPQDATVLVEDHVHESTAHLGDTWERFDEWYDFRDDPRDRVHVLLSVDPSSLPASQMAADHPIAWCHDYDGGRAWYTALGHTDESWAEPAFLLHVLGGIRTAAGMTSAACSPSDVVAPASTAPSTSASTTTTVPSTTTTVPSTTTTTPPPSTVPAPASASASTTTAPIRIAPGVETRPAESTTRWGIIAVVGGTVVLVASAMFVVRRRRASR